MLLKLTNSAALLLAFCWLQSFLINRLNLSTTLNQVVTGILFGGICIIERMMLPPLSSGLTIDAHTVILGLSGAFFGPLVAAITAIIASSFSSLIASGVSGLTDAVLTATSVLFGISFYYGRKKNWVRIEARQLLAFGFILHTALILVLAPMLNELARQELLATAVPLIAIFSIATMLVGKLLKEAKYHRSMTRALDNSEARQRTAFNAITDNLFLINEDGRCLEVLSLSTEPPLNKQEKVIGQTLHDLFPKHIADPAIESIRKTVTTREPHSFEYEHHTNHGLKQFKAHTQPSEMVIDGKRSVVTLIRDISEGHQLKNREQRLLKTQHALSQINEAVIRLENESDLLPHACRIAVEQGTAFLAWVGVIEKGDLILPRAWHGADESYFKNLVISSDPDAPGGQSPAGIAFREKRAVVVNDFSKDKRVAPWRNKAMRAGILASAAFPILRQGEPYAVFVAGSDQANAFDDEAIEFLEHVARSISFALDNSDREVLRIQAEIDLEESESRFRQVVHEAPFPMLIHTEKGEVLLANDAWTRLTCYKQRDIPKRIRTAVKKLFRDKASDAMEDIRQLLVGQHHTSNEYTIYRKDGSERTCIFESSLLGTFSDGSKAIISMAIDLTDRRSTEKALKLTQFSVNQASFPIMWITSDGHFHFVNEAACSMYGYSKEEFASLSIYDFDKSYTPEKWRSYWQELKESKSLQFEATNITKENKSIAVEMYSNFLEYDGIEYDCVFIRDITEKKKAEEIIWHQANYDSLTGLPNRRMFIDRLGLEMSKSARTNLPVAILFIDLDDFKNVNDTFGHDTGDALLKKVSQRLQTCIRTTDTLARLGGDEFTIIMSNVHGRSPIERVCRSILEKLSEPFHMNGEVAHITASIGITLYPDDATTIEELMINADQAMYTCKRQGRHRHQFFTPSMQKASQNRKQLTQLLRDALGTEQIYTAYQPIVELSSGNVHKVEALVRWKQPQYGMISPAELISVAEESGMIHELSAQIFHSAVKQATNRRQEFDPEFQVFVNMSPHQLRSGDPKKEIWSDFIENAKQAGSSIILEITEALLLNANENVGNQLHTLRNAGLGIAVDDFGTGFSSLSHLKKFGVGFIKIDRAIVMGLSPDSDDLSLCEAIIAMAHKLGIKVIAEGVETEMQRTLLMEAGCDYAQGYFFSPPLSEEALTGYLNKMV